VIWRLDRLEALQSAEEEITRRLTYQPLGKYWAFPLARMLADRLAPTRIRPNAVTLAAGVLMLSSAGLVAFGSTTITFRCLTAGAMALALVLDTADGRLARSQGTSSAFGRWLDQVLDELADIALHASIAWATFQASARADWLLVGIIYASGKYLFVIQSLLGEELEKTQETTSALPGASNRTERPCVIPGGRGSRRASLPQGSPGNSPSQDHATPLSILSLTSRLARGLGHADFRWHLWIVLALAGRLEFALLIYAAYFPARALAGVARKVVRYA
jgi:phosphatidylglycerophosphate synthase